MWVDKRPKSLDFKVQKSLKGLKKTKTKTLQSNTSVWNFRPPWKRKILKGNQRGKNRLSTGKKHFKDYRFLKINKEAKSQWTDSYGVLKKNNWRGRILCPAKLK